MSIAKPPFSANPAMPNPAKPHLRLKAAMLAALSLFWSDEDGTTAVEYAVMLAIIAAVCFVTVQVMVTAAEESFQTSGDAIAAAG